MEIYFYKTSSELKAINKECELIERKECSLINDTDRTNPSLTIDKSLINSNIIFIPSFGRWYNLASVERVNNNWVRANYHVDLLMSFKDELLEKSFLINRQESNLNPYLIDNMQSSGAEKEILIAKFEGGILNNSNTLTNNYVLEVAGA